MRFSVNSFLLVVVPKTDLRIHMIWPRYSNIIILPQYCVQVLGFGTNNGYNYLLYLCLIAVTKIFISVSMYRLLWEESTCRVVNVMLIST